MPTIFVYSLADFVGGLPDEVGAKADGATPITLTLVEGAVPTAVEIADDDDSFDELDPGQAFAAATTVDGQSFDAGQGIFAAYDLVNTDTGLQVTAFTTGDNGFQQGAVSGLVATQPLDGGESYTFDLNRSSNENEVSFDGFAACFAAGTMIACEGGLRRVEELAIGDVVQTRDHGLQPVRWVGSRALSAADLAETPTLRPVLIRKGAYGATADLMVSPEHRMVVATAEQEVLLATADSLVPAKALIDGARVTQELPEDGVTYVHVMFDRHEIVFANGAESESFRPTKHGQSGLDAAARAELLSLFPTLLDAVDGAMAPAAPVLGKGAQSVLRGA